MTTHEDVRLPSQTRAALLRESMTLPEKCHQLGSVMAWTLVNADGSDTNHTAELLEHPPGNIGHLIVDDPAQLARIVGAIQRTVVERSRLGIPVLIHGEAVNGFLAGGHMVFPTAIGLAASWSPDLVGQMAELIRDQMVRTGVRQALSPVMDVATDPRWGRVHETYGEDPYLAAALSVAYVRGLQGADLRQAVIATAKHFLGYAVPQGGLNTAAVEIGSRALRDVFAFPFEAAIQDVGLGSVMNSYSDLDGVPVGASREVLTDLLRGVLGFDGFVASDYGTIARFVEQQRVAATPGQAAGLALAAGLDVELPTSYGYGDALAQSVGRGEIEMGLVDQSVHRLLTAKFAVGLFENPYPPERIEVGPVAAEGAELSAELAARSVVLVSNDGLLPLAPGARVAVIGPHADAVSHQFPAYTYPGWRDAIDAQSRGEVGTMLGTAEVMQAWYDAFLPPAPVDTIAREGYGATSLAEEIGVRSASVTAVAGCRVSAALPGGVEHAVAAARGADVVVLALGGVSLWHAGERTEGEASDTADIGLPSPQVELAAAVAATGTPVVVVLVQGRAYTLPEAVTGAGAVVVSTYAGPFGPAGVAQVLFGQVNPSGRLPYSIPRHGGQVPVFHYQKAGSGFRSALPPGVGQHYLDLPATPLFGFGHGLSYTSFQVSELELPRRVGTDGHAVVGVRVSNTGARAGATVVQLYGRVNTVGVTRPAQQLLGFVRVELGPGESRRVRWRVDATQLGYTNLAREFAVERARVEVMVGFASDDHRLTGGFDLTGPSRVLTAADRTYLTAVETHPY